MICIDIPLRRRKLPIIASFDLEWTKNYRVKNGNRPFCFSLVTLHCDAKPEELPHSGAVGVFSAYSEQPGEASELLKTADAVFGDLLRRGDTLVGHQLSSDLAVMLNLDNSSALVNLRRAQCAWRARKGDPTALVVDTRYDIDSLLTDKSRRLVDVCESCNLEVTQPELAGSMTRMQQKHFATGDTAIRERLTVLNIRHSLSAALLCRLWQRQRLPSTAVNVNAILARVLGGHLSYLEEQEFRKLLHRRR